MRSHAGRNKMNDKGSAMVMVLTIISLVAILGALAMSTALVNIKVRGLNRNADKNFYFLETALDEIHAQVGRVSSELLKEEYAYILSRLYQDHLKTNELANEALKISYINALEEKMGLSSVETEAVRQLNQEAAARYLKSLATTFVSDEVRKEQFHVTVGDVIFLKEQTVYRGLVMKDVCLTYVNPDTDTESAVTVDLKIETPYIRFINGGDAMLDYILVSNQEVAADSSGLTSLESVWNGNIYGGKITVNQSVVHANTSLMTAAGNLTVKNSGSLNIGPDTDAGGASRVWADGVELSMRSKLTGTDSSFFIKDDLTLRNNDNQVKLGGSYYGYGNEGREPDGTVIWDASKSSAILLNDKNSRVDFRGVDSLMLAGKAYLRFNAGSDTEDYSQYIYPLGESLAVRATQSIYLVPEACIKVGTEGGSLGPSGSNPVAIPNDVDKMIIQVEIPGGSVPLSQEYEVTMTQAGSESSIVINQAGDGPALLVALNGKIYVYYNFEDDKARSAYFESYLEEHSSSFDALLQKSGVTGESENGGGVFIKEDGQLLTSGSLYQVLGRDGDEHPMFELLRMRNESVSDSLQWVKFGENLSLSFQNLKENLSESMRISGSRETGSGLASLLPLGNYVRISKLKALSQDLHVKQGDGSVLLSSKDLEIEVSETGASVKGSDTTEIGSGGLIVSAGTIKITGEGEFHGLIMAQGTITINGNVILTADAGEYASLLEHEKISPYFYDYSDAASTVLNRYEDFVTLENWSRTGREQRGAE